MEIRRGGAYCHTIINNHTKPKWKRVTVQRKRVTVLLVSCDSAAPIGAAFFFGLFGPTCRLCDFSRVRVQPERLRGNRGERVGELSVAALASWYLKHLYVFINLIFRHIA